MKRFLGLLVTFSIMLPLLAVNAATPQRGNVALLLDLSGSMNAELEGKTRRDVAIESLKSSVSSIGDKASLGLYAFGTKFDNSPSNKDASCNDIERLVNYGKGNSGAINEVLTGLEAKGWTPLAKAIATIGDDLALFGDSEHHLIILSDGEESCGGDPIAEVEKLKANGVNVIVNTIGLDVDANTKAQLQGIAAAGGGEYFDAADSGQLTASLEKAVNSEPVELQGEANFGNENVIPEGGSDFSDAVELDIKYFDGETYTLPKHIQAGTYHTYKLPIDKLEEGDNILIGQILKTDAIFNDDGTVTTTTEGSFLEFEITFYNKRKAKLRTFNKWGETNSFKEEDLYIDDSYLDDVTYMFIGNADKSTSKDSEVYFELTKADGRSVEDLIAGKEATADSSEDDEENNESQDEDSEERSSDENPLAGLLGDDIDLEQLIGGNADLASLLGAQEDIAQTLTENRKELMKTEEGRAILKALGQDVEESFFQQKTMGIKNMYLAGGAAALLLLLVLAIVGLSKRKK